MTNVTPTTDPLAREILLFWFGAPGSAEYGQPRKAWFQKDPLFDDEIRQRFGLLHQQASRGECDAWRQQPDTMLALIILLDQFSRNLYRNSGQAFANDAKALALASEAVAQGFDQQVMPIARVFCYLPFEHSESLVQQARSLALFAELHRDQPTYAEFVAYAQKHYDVIATFGRFPHRNALLGRVSSAAEQRYLDQGGPGF